MKFFSLIKFMRMRREWVGTWLIMFCRVLLDCVGIWTSSSLGGMLSKWSFASLMIWYMIVLIIVRIRSALSKTIKWL